MIRRNALLIALSFVLAAAARGAPQSDLSAETTTLDEATGETILRGNATLVDTGLLLNADEIRYNQKTQIAVATGNVVLTRIGDRVLADRLTFNRAKGTFTAENLRIGKFPYYIWGPRAEGTRAEVIIHDATVTYGEPGRWQPTIRARTLAYSPGHYLRMANADVGIGKYQPLPISRMGQDLARNSGFSAVSFDGGYRRSLGAYAETGLVYPFMPGLSAGPELGLFTFRGLMLGPVVSYDVKSGDDTMVGTLKSGYMYDLGDRLTDILNEPVPPNRAYVEWQHNQQVTPDLTITGSINWSTDSEVIRDFYSKEFVPVQEPDNFVEAVYTGSNFLGSAFGRFQPDAYYPVQQRLPEIRFDVLPTLVGGGVYVRFNSGIAYLDENPPAGGAHLATDRFDTFLGVTRPFSFGDFLELNPVLGGRFTKYWSTVGATDPGGTGRALGEFGFDANLKLSSTWEYKNPLLHIDGLRHLLTPILQYRYIPDADKSTAWIPPIDRLTFSTYLPILELGDIRAIDQLQAENVLRVGLHNTLQTRDAVYGSRDLLMFNVEDDVRFDRAPGVSDFSRIFAEMKATPARWLELRLEDSVTASGFAQRARDATVTVREGEVWSFGVGFGYLSDQFRYTYIPGLGPFPIVGLNTYHLEARMRLTEEIDAFVRGDYDDRKHIFVDQYYGIAQRLSNTWIVDYAVTISNGPNKGQDHFGFNTTLNLIRF